MLHLSKGQMLIIKVEHTDYKCDFLTKIIFVLHRLILWNVFFNMTHVLPLISAQNYDKNAIQNRCGRPVLNTFGYIQLCWQPYRKFPDLLHETILNQHTCPES